ncbi:MAG: hypothetical protein N0A16_07795 [Blastocatellia bacterium]|nr:hypothetical protein [Blastocatellia bacterium]MCS7157616.1 hypothetical protein [Blastocatellia bacterium]MCX7751881.1 hypothetical protein [Blastocatellia bacterium]MDW8166987.1 hypothetical protein [Acidobacteriota bacterium]MDW8257091.1 hypothetical protein [Acidobacteriota bacterium]
MKNVDKKRLAILSALLVILAVVWLRDVGSDPEGTALHRPNQTVSAGGNRVARSSAPTPGGSALAEEGFRPLPLFALEEQTRRTAVEVGRNIFVYYVPPTPVSPKEPAGPPPTIRVTSLSPESVYARTGDFVLYVRGESFPEDARIVVNGREQPTERVSPMELKTTIGRQWISAPGKLTILVRNDRGEFSAPMTLAVLEPPAPEYKYVGRIADLVFLASGEDRYAVRVGQLVDQRQGNRWRVVTASDTHVTIQDVLLGVTHRVEMETTQTAATTPAPSPMTPFERRRFIQERLRQQMEEMSPEEEEPPPDQVPPEEQELLQKQQPPPQGPWGQPMTPQQIRQQLQQQLQQLRNRPNRNW